MKRCTLALLVLSLLGPAACASDPPGSGTGGISLLFARLAAAGCEPSSAGTGSLPKDADNNPLIDSLTVFVYDPARAGIDFLTIPSKDLGAGATWLVPNVPETIHKDENGEKYSSPLAFEVYACNADKQVVYAGRTLGITVADQKVTDARLYLAHAGAASCAGNQAAAQGGSLGEARTLAEGVPLASGDAVFIGGLNSFSGTGGIASHAVDFYNHQSGGFRTGPTLASGRVLHHALRLDDSRVLIAGGFTSLEYYDAATHKPPYPPILAPPLPASSVLASPPAEMIDGSSGLALPSKVLPGQGKSPFSSGVRTANHILFVGGLNPDSDTVAAQAAFTRLDNLDDVIAGNAGTATNGTLAVARYGAGAVAFNDDAVLVWGGNTDADVANIAEMIGPGEAKGVVRKVNWPSGAKDIQDQITKKRIVTTLPVVVRLGANDERVLFLVSGGLPITASGALPFTEDMVSYVVSASRDASKPIEVQALGLSKPIAPRAYAKGTVIERLDPPRQTLRGIDILIPGGYVKNSQSQLCPSAKSECLLDEVTVLRLEGDPMSTKSSLVRVDDVARLKGGALGVAHAPLPLGVVIAGGLTTVVGKADSPMGAEGTVVLPPRGTSEDEKADDALRCNPPK